MALPTAAQTRSARRQASAVASWVAPAPPTRTAVMTTCAPAQTPARQRASMGGLPVAAAQTAAWAARAKATRWSSTPHGNAACGMAKSACQVRPERIPQAGMASAARLAVAVRSMGSAAHVGSMAKDVRRPMIVARAIPVSRVSASTLRNDQRLGHRGREAARVQIRISSLASGGQHRELHAISRREARRGGNRRSPAALVSTCASPLARGTLPGRRTGVR